MVGIALVKNRIAIPEHRALLGVLAAHNLETLRRKPVPQSNGLQKAFFSILLGYSDRSESNRFLFEPLSPAAIHEVMVLP